MNQFGRLFQVHIFGESHGDIVGVLVDGMPCGIKVSSEDFQPDLLRRKSGGLGTTPRLEADEIHISSGVFNGYTTGRPILLTFQNQNTHSKDYSKFTMHPRPSHADFVAERKYRGFQDYRGGGAFSGRLTLGLVAAGVLAKKILPDVRFDTKITNLGGETRSEAFEEVLKKAVESKDSVGGIVSIRVSSVPIGLGEPYFNSLESTISHLLFSVGGVKGVEFGVGFSGVGMKGSEFNDRIVDSAGNTATNHNGGINGGISNGNPLELNVFVKPTASIGIPQETFDFQTNRIEPLTITGRHDAAIVLRAQVVLENCVAIALADAVLLNKVYRKDESK